MEQLFPGALIRRERLRRSWSQEGLCSGICAVSYLSKIEQGKAEASPEILRLLFARLELPWHDDEAFLQRAGELTERCYEAIFCCDEPALDGLRKELAAAAERMTDSPCALDAAILQGFFSRQPIGEEMEPFLDLRQLALQRLLQSRDEEAMRLYPCAYVSLMAGIGAYEQGGSDAAALQYLRRACEMAAEEGQVRIMLLARLYMGNCYCNRVDLKNMDAQYRVARRLAQALGDEETLQIIRYNTASAQLEAGRCGEAYRYFASAEQPSLMDLHKLAICCEKLGRREEALDALNRADAMETDYPDLPLARQMCSLVRFRLEHADYFRSPEYGQTLLEVFDQCRKKLPIGYASFHLPWVLEWYTASRQYRAAYELLLDFPVKPAIK